MAQSKIQRVYVQSAQDMEQTIVSHVAQGFVVVNKTSTSSTLQKKKEFKIIWAVIGFILCILPLLIYLIVYATQAEYEVIDIQVSPPPQ